MSNIAVVQKKELYHLVAEFNPITFGEAVQRRLNAGWLLVGEPFVFDTRVCQALRKTEEVTS